RPPPTLTLFPYTTLFRSPPHTTRSCSDTTRSATHRSPTRGRCHDRNAPHHPPKHAATARTPDYPPTGHTKAASHPTLPPPSAHRSEEHTSELQSRENLVC